MNSHTQRLFDLICNDIADMQYTVKQIKELDTISQDTHTLTALTKYDIAISSLIRLRQDMLKEFSDLAE